MLDTTFDTFVQRAAARVSRRGSLLALGGVSLATLAGPVRTAAKKKRRKKGRKNNAKRLANRKCQQQADECATASAARGFDASEIACCDFLANCDSASYIQCLAA